MDFFYIGNYAISLLTIFCLKKKRTIPDIIATSFFYGLTIFFLGDYSVLVRQIAFILINFGSFYYSEKTIPQAVTKSFIIEPLQQFSTTIILSLSSLFILKNSIDLSPVMLLLLPALLSCVVAILLRKLLIRLESINQILTPVMMVFSIILFAYTLYPIFVFDVTYTFNDNWLNNRSLTGIFIAFFITLTILLTLNWLNDRKRKRLVDDQIQLELDRAYINQLEQHSLEIRKFRHDQNNLLLSINAFIAEDNFPGLKDYYSKHVGIQARSINSLDRQLTSLANIDNLPIKSIVYTKLQLANIQGIEVTLEVLDSIHISNKNVASLVRILGIFLDNSIEALKDLGYGSLSVVFFKMEDTIHIIIQNDCDSSIIQSISLLEEEEFSTKGKNRGLGLSNVKALLRNRPILLETNISENKFTQELIVLPERG